MPPHRRWAIDKRFMTAVWMHYGLWVFILCPLIGYLPVDSAPQPIIKSYHRDRYKFRVHSIKFDSGNSTVPWEIMVWNSNFESLIRIPTVHWFYIPPSTITVSKTIGPRRRIETAVSLGLSLKSLVIGPNISIMGRIYGFWPTMETY